MIYFSKTARNFFTIHSLPKVDNISFHLNLVSQLAVLVCTIGVHGNISNSKQSLIAIYSQEHAWEDHFRCYISPKRLKFVHDTISRQGRQYFLSHEPSQPIGRAGVSAWCSFKQRQKKTVDRAKSGHKLIWHSIRWYIYQKRLEIFPQFLPCLNLTIFPFIWTQSANWPR